MMAPEDLDEARTPGTADGPTPRRTVLSRTVVMGSIVGLALIVSATVGVLVLGSRPGQAHESAFDAVLSVADEVGTADLPLFVPTTEAPVVEAETATPTSSVTFAEYVEPAFTESDAGIGLDGSFVPAESSLIATALVTQGAVDVWASPIDDEPTWSLAVPTEFGGDRHFLVVGESQDWLKVQVPVRPNESVGWIPKEAATLTTSPYHVEVDLSERAVRVWKSDELVIDTTSAIGQAKAPTPLGSFYIRDVLPWDAASVYGPYVVALSAYSEHIDQINGGDAVVAIHGTSRPNLLGQAVSLGCIRLHNDVITMLAETVPVGTPVTVVA